MFDIKDYMWDIFKISELEGVHDIKLAFNLFIINAELGKDRYGKSDIDYEEINNKYKILTEREKELQKKEFDIIIDEKYKYLCVYYNHNNKTDFDFFSRLHIKSNKLNDVYNELNKICSSKHNKAKKIKTKRKRRIKMSIS